MNYIYQAPLDYKKGVGVVLGSFSPLHRGHLDVIYKAKKECLGGALVIVCGYEGDKGYPRLSLKERYQMVREFFIDDPLVAVYCLSDDEMGIREYAERQADWQWETWVDHLWSDVIALNSTIDRSLTTTDITFYVGEPEYDSDLRALGYQTVLVPRSINPISATMIRNNPIKYWDQMAWTFHRRFSHNILITGTASEGKTTLVEDIGRYFNIPYSYEWARGYMKEHNVLDWELDARDFTAFLYGQYNHNRECIESRHNPGIFIADSDAIVTKMYAQYYAEDPEMAMSKRDYELSVEPVANMFIRKSRWDKIFILDPKAAAIEDDHERYMKHSDLEIRQKMQRMMAKGISDAGWEDKVEYLNGTYLENFEKVKNYINGVMEGAKNG